MWRDLRDRVLPGALVAAGAIAFVYGLCLLPNPLVGDVRAQQVGPGPSSGGAYPMGGVAASNAVIAHNPLLIGAEALASQPAAATAGNQRRLVSSLDGALYVRPGGPVPWSCSLDNIGATLTQCQAAAGAGLKHYVTDIYIGSTTGSPGQFLVRTGTGVDCATGTASLFPSAATVVRFPYSANVSTGGMTPLGFETPLNPPAASAICIICVATNTCTVQMQGYTAP